MATKVPLVVGSDGRPQQLQSGDLLSSYLNQTSTSIGVASTTDLSTATGVYVVLTSTGASAITSFGTAAAGTIRLVRNNAGAIVLTYNATSMILPTASNITMATGDEFWAVSEGSGNWRVAPYAKTTGRPLADSPAYASPSGMRLSTESGVPLSIGNRTSQGTLYLCVDKADYLLIPKTDISDFDVWAPGQLSLSLTMTNGKIYDVFCWNNAGTPTMQLSSAWTDDSTRANALGTIKGVKVNDGAIGSMGSGRGIWLGTVRASGTNVTEISNALLGVWNKYNQRPMPLAVGDSTVSWTYASTTWRQANGASGNKIQAVFGERQSNSVKVLWINSNASGAGGYGDIGVNSTSSGSAQIHNFSSPVGGWAAGLASYEAIQEPGFYSYNWLEAAQSGYTVTFLGYVSGSGNPTNACQAGIFGSIMG